MAKKDDSQSGLGIYLRLLTYVKPYWVPFLIGIVGFLLYAASQTGYAALMEYLVDAISKEENTAYIWGPIALLLIAFVRGVGTFTGNYFIAYVARMVVHQLRTVMFDRLLTLPIQYFHDNSSGHILSKITYNVEQVTRAATDSIKIVIREGATVIGLLAYLLYLNWQLTLVFAAVSPFIAIIVLYTSKRFRRLGHRIQDSMGEVTHVIAENVQGIHMVRVFGGSDVESKRFFAASEHNLKQSLKMAATEALSTPIVQFIVSSSLALLIYLALNPMMGSNMSAGTFIAFITAAGLIAKPLRTLTEVNGVIQRGISAAESLFELMDRDGEKDRGTVELQHAKGDLKIQNLAFSYNSQDEETLQNINLEIEAGKTFALVGKSGSGKSTLVSLLPRFYDYSKGEVLLDDQPITEFTLKSLREQIALVSQHVVLFAGTVRENIAYGVMQDASDEEILAAAEAAHVMEFANRLPDGLDTLVGENGVKLSGGQRQRIAIARAILKNSPLLILDEATSALDTESERHIQAALENVMQGRTTIVIAHRLSTIENADTIVVMERGQIVEQGTHQQLLDRGEVYASLYQMQFEDPAVIANSEVEEQERVE